VREEEEGGKKREKASWWRDKNRKREREGKRGKGKGEGKRERKWKEGREEERRRGKGKGKKEGKRRRESVRMWFVLLGGKRWISSGALDLVGRGAASLETASKLASKAFRSSIGKSFSSSMFSLER
jgi:hypothetical protein